MNAEDSDDLLLALQLFDGKLVLKCRQGSNYSSREEGLFGVRELVGDERSRSRAAIARLLLSANPPAELLGRLAAAFAPEGDATAGPVKAEVSFRGPNVADKQVHAAQMIVEIQANRVHGGMTLEAAQAAVDQKHGYRGAAKSTWESVRWREIRANVEGAMPLPDKRRG